MADLPSEPYSIPARVLVESSRELIRGAHGVSEVGVEALGRHQTAHERVETGVDAASC